MLLLVEGGGNFMNFRGGGGGVFPLNAQKQIKISSKLIYYIFVAYFYNLAVSSTKDRFKVLVTFNDDKDIYFRYKKFSP